MLTHKTNICSPAGVGDGGMEGVGGWEEGGRPCKVGSKALPSSRPAAPQNMLLLILLVPQDHHHHRGQGVEHSAGAEARRRGYA